MLSVCLITWAQVPVIVTKQIKTINGKNYYAHVVEKGQTVFSIARAYGVNYHDAVLKSDIDKIAIGDTVYLPTNEKPEPAKFHYYVVKQGNTLYSIAKTYQVEVDDILKLNPKIENNNIKVGEVIKIPMEKSAKDNSTSKTSQPQQNTVNSQSQQPAPIYKPIKDSKQEAKEQKELEKQQKEAEAKAKKEQERLQKEAAEKEAKEKKELEKQQKEALAKDAKEKKELEKQQREAEAKAKKEQERQQKEAEAKAAKERKELEKKQKEAEEQRIREQKEAERQQKEAEAKAKKEQERLQKEAKEKEAREKKDLEKQQKEAEAQAKKDKERLQKEAKDKEAQEIKELEEQKKELEKQRKELEKQQKELERQQKEFEKKQKEAEKSAKKEQQTVSENNVQPQNNPKAEFRPMGRKAQPTDVASNGFAAQQPATEYEQPKSKTEVKPKTETKAEPIAKAEPAKKTVSITTPEQPKTQSQPAPEPKKAENPAPKQATPKTLSDDYNYAELPLQTAPNIGKSVPAPNVLIRDRVSKENIQITLMIPLYLSNLNEISTSKFDIEQRKKRKYKSFEFIQFYEGVLLGIESLRNEGCNVILNVVDIPGDLPDKVEQSFSTYNIAQSDLIIALLEKNAFEKAAQLAQQNNVFILNPFSSRPEILDQNPYVVKLAPSYQGIISSVLSMVTKSYSSPNLFIVHSNSKLEKRFLDEFQQQLKNQNKIKYTIFDWSANAKLVGMLKASPDDNIVINLYDQNKDKNKTQSSLILNRLFSVKKNTPTLITMPNWASKYEDIDYNQLQRLNYHFLSNSYLDYNNPKHKAFIERFKEKYKTEPLGNYAALGNDIIIHFVAGINSKGTEKFWQDPNTERRHSMLYYFHFKRSAPDKGFENQNAYFYRLNTKYQFVPAN